MRPARHARHIVGPAHNLQLTCRRLAEQPRKAAHAREHNHAPFPCVLATAAAANVDWEGMHPSSSANTLTRQGETVTFT